jgi:hypothetical protein
MRHGIEANRGEGRTKRSSANVRKRLEALGRYLDGMTIRQIDSDVLAVLKQLPVLSSWRPLDALHLATAMLFQRHIEEPLNCAPSIKECAQLPAS